MRHGHQTKNYTKAAKQRRHEAITYTKVAKIAKLVQRSSLPLRSLCRHLGPILRALRMLCGETSRTMAFTAEDAEAAELQQNW